jgi:hypothetical protein
VHQLNGMFGLPIEPITSSLLTDMSLHTSNLNSRRHPFSIKTKKEKKLTTENDAQ